MAGLWAKGCIKDTHLTCNHLYTTQVSLCARLREILVAYPEGTSILKELLQNADDAGATRVAFCLDTRAHPTSTLVSAALAPFQGPALLAYNNAVFTQADFDSITRIGDSGKRGTAAKTGRFGVVRVYWCTGCVYLLDVCVDVPENTASQGFNSAYHLTDVPSFVSGTPAATTTTVCAQLPHPQDATSFFSTLTAHTCPTSPPPTPAKS